MAINFPVPTFIGQQYTPPGSTITYQWDGTCWNIVPQMGPMYIGDTPPPNPAVGQKWWRSTNGQEYLWYDDGTSKQWVQSAGAAGMPGLWEPIPNANGGLRHSFTGVTSYDVKDLGAFQELRLIGFVVPTAQCALVFRTSSDNGLNFYAGASDYSYNYIQSTGGAAPTAAAAAVAMGYFSNTCDAGQGIFPHAEFENFNVAGTTEKALRVHTKQRGGGSISVSLWSGNINRSEAMNALRLVNTVSTTMTGNFILEGVRG